MARREPTGGRRSPFRTARRLVLIVIGANRTETAYLKGLRDHFRLAAVTMKIVEKPGAPDQLVALARKLDPTGTGHTRNPSTGVWRLVGVILEKE